MDIGSRNTQLSNKECTFSTTSLLANFTNICSFTVQVGHPTDTFTCGCGDLNGVLACSNSLLIFIFAPVSVCFISPVFVLWAMCVLLAWCLVM